MVEVVVVVAGPSLKMVMVDMYEFAALLYPHAGESYKLSQSYLWLMVEVVVVVVPSLNVVVKPVEVMDMALHVEGV